MLAPLKAELARAVDSELEPLAEQPFLTSARHLNCISQTRHYLEAFQAARKNGLYEEMLAFELRAAAEQLSAILGRIDSDEVLGVLFGEFCIGK
jgi:tRNA modification GTPase